MADFFDTDDETPENTLAPSKLGIEDSWIQGDPNTPLPMAKISQDEWNAANVMATKLITTGKQPPFKIFRATDLGKETNHSFLVIPTTNNKWKIAAMARGKLHEEGILGHGASGVVKLLQFQDGNISAVKIAPAENSNPEEMSALHKLGHVLSEFTRQRATVTPWINKTPIKNKQYIIQTKHKGIGLHHYLETLQEPLQSHTAANIALQTALAVMVAHQNDILHCDIKPDNFIVTPDGPAVLIDYGKAKHLSPEHPEIIDESLAVGTPPYIAPEIAEFMLDENDNPIEDPNNPGKALIQSLKGHYSKAADIYSLGTMFFNDLGIDTLLVQEMMLNKPNQRPTIETIVAELQATAKLLQEEQLTLKPEKAGATHTAGTPLLHQFHNVFADTPSQELSTPGPSTPGPSTLPLILPQESLVRSKTPPSRPSTAPESPTRNGSSHKG